MPKISEKDLEEAAREVDAALLDQLDREMEGMPKHTFSPKFNRLMHEICPSIDPETGEVS